MYDLVLVNALWVALFAYVSTLAARSFERWLLQRAVLALLRDSDKFAAVLRPLLGVRARPGQETFGPRAQC